MGTVASQVTSLTIFYTTVYSDADQSKHQSSASLAFVWGIHRVPVNSPHKWPVTRKMFPLDYVIMQHCFRQWFGAVRHQATPMLTQFCVTVWHHQATMSYTPWGQCWPYSMSSYGVIRQQWVKLTPFKKLVCVTHRFWDEKRWVHTLQRCVKWTHWLMPFEHRVICFLINA